MALPYHTLLSGLTDTMAVLVIAFAGFVLIRGAVGPTDTVRQRGLLGVLFGCSVVYAMTFPAAPVAGIPVDLRAALLALAGLSGGPAVGGLALLAAVAHHLWLGGAGVIAGLAGSAMASAVGLGLWYAARRGADAAPGWPSLALAAGGAAGTTLLGLLLVQPLALGRDLLLQAGPTAALAQAVGVLLLGGLMHVGERRPSKDERRYRYLAESAPAAICITEEESGRFLFANRRAHHLLQVPDGELLGRRMPSFYVDPEQREEIVRKVRDTGDTEERVIEIVTAAGRDAALAVTVRPVEWQRRRALLWAAVDVSGTRETYRELNRQDALNRTILETLLDGLIVMAPNGEIRTFNTMAEHIFGWPADEVIGRDISLLLGDDVIDAQQSTATYLRDFVDQQRRQSTVGRREIQGRRRDGSVFPLEFTAAEISVGDDVAENYFLGIVRDVTERRRAIDALIAARTEAEVAQRTQRDFLAHMSHELRTPLNSILGFSELIQLGTGGPISDKHREYAASIHLAGDHLLRLINDVLDLSKVEQGYLVLHEDRVGPEELLDAVVRLFQPKAQERHLVLEVRAPETSFDIRGDFVRLRQILFNLVSNALKFSPHGGRILVEVSRTKCGGVCLAVQDDGPGMAAADIDVALKPFGQVRSEITRSHEGTGLGLAISKSLAERHDGRLEIVSETGRGTTVSVRLPASRVLPREVGAEPTG